MLNVFDVLNKYKSRLDPYLLNMNSRINNITMHIDYLEDVFDNTYEDAIDVAELAAKKGISQAQYVKNLALSICTMLDDLTLTDVTGQVINFNIDVHSDYAYGTIDDGVIRTIIQWDAEIPEPFFRYNGISDSLPTLRSVFEWIVDVSGVNYIISQAIALVQNAELTISNFLSSIQDVLDAANDKIKYVVNVIKDCISSTSVYGQAIALVNALKQLFGTIGSATANDTDMKITFNNTDYSISSAFLLPMTAVVNLASTVLSTILYVIKPILGAIIYAIGAGISKLLEVIENNDTSHFEFVKSDSRDTDCFAMPFVQYKDFPYERLPQSVKDGLSTYGMAKSTCGVMTLYFWVVDDSLTFVNVEGYLNARCDVLYNTPSVSDGLASELENLLTIPTQDIRDNICLTNHDVSEPRAENLIRHWLDDGSTPGGEAPYYEDNSSYGIEQRDALAARRLMYGFMLLLYIYLSVSDYEANHNFGISLQDFISGIKRNGSVTRDLQICVGIYYEIWYNTDPDSPWTNVWNGYPNSGTNFIIRDIVNIGFPALRNLYGSMSTSPGSHWSDFFQIFTWNESDFTTSTSDIGCGSNMVTTYSVYNKGQSYVLPPQHVYNVWVRAAFTSAIIVGIAVTTAIVAAKVKRAIKVKALAEKARISNMADEATTTADWKAVYKESKKYNRTWGRLSGSTYDCMNDWVDYSETANVSNIIESLTSSEDPSMDDQPISVQSHATNLDEVIKLIKPID